MLILTSGRFAAQDGHFWSNNYGSRSTILNGVVIGSVDDLGAVYYNPARLGISEGPGFILSGKVYEWNILKIDDALNEGLDLKESDFGGVPSLLAGTFNVSFLPKHQFGYAFLTRYQYGADFFVREEREGNYLPEVPGNELFDGKFFWDTKLKEEWIGLAWSFPLSEKIRIGATGFYAERKKSAGFDMRLTAVSMENEVAQLIQNKKLSYNAKGLLAKIGVTIDLNPVSLGLTVTTPKWSLTGKGNLIYEDILTGLEEDRYLSSIQDGLSARHRWPWSVGVGAGIRVGKNQVHLSGEWFSRVPKYTIMAIDDFIGQTSGDTIRHKVVEELNSIFNFGIGYEYFFNDRFSAHASFATDYTAVTRDVNRFLQFAPEINNSTSQKDLYHFGAGASLKFKAIEFTLGATYASSKDRISRPIDFPDDDTGQGEDSEEVSTIHFHTWRFVFGFEIFFLEDLQKKTGIDIGE